MTIFYRNNSIKIIPLFFFLLPIFLFGCRSMEVNNNKFISSRRPYLAAKVSPEFKYLAHYQFKEERLSVNKQTHNRIISDSFFFIPTATTKGILPKYAYILIEEIPDSRFVQPFLNYKSGVTERVIMQLGRYDFVTITQISFPDSKIDKRLQHLIKDGFTMPECVLKRSAARVVNLEKRYIIIVYGEDATLSGYGSEKWKDVINLTDEQKKYIIEFDKRASSAFEVLASD